MTKHFFVCLALLGIAQLSMGASVTKPHQIPTYYAAVDGTSDGGLFDAIHTTAKKGYSGLSYKNLWTAYRTTDVYPADSARKAGHIWDMYGTCDFVYQNDQCGSYRNECDCYNREHSIPKSWFGDKKEITATPGTDLFHIVPTDGSVNNTRSSYAFGEVQNASYQFAGSKFGNGKAVSITNTMLGDETTSSTCVGVRVFEPKDEYKGDFARMYMGTLLRWNKDYEPFTTGDGKKIFSGKYTAAGLWGLTEYGIALLLKWHREDPVSRKEIDRNNAVQAAQGNRNPFIDYPYLAEYMWGERAGEQVKLDHMLPSTDPEFIPGQSNGWKGGDPQALEMVQTTPRATKILKDGQIYIVVDEQVYTITGQRIK